MVAKLDPQKLQKQKMLQSLPLEQKIKLTKQRIKEWFDFNDGDIYVAFSGGKDSTVLSHIVNEVYPDENIPLVFCSTGMELPEIMEFVRKQKNLKIIKPKLNHKQVFEKYGYPVISKENAQKIEQYRNASDTSKTKKTRMYGDSKGNGKLPKKWQFMFDAPFNVTSRCCDIFKKNPSKKYEKETGLKPMIGTMAGESRLRSQRPQCNMYDAKRPTSAPLHFWSEKDIWEYIKTRNVEISKAYTEKGFKRTGCIFCLYGSHLSESTMDRMETTHPKLYKYCKDKLNLVNVDNYVKSLGTIDYIDDRDKVDIKDFCDKSSVDIIPMKIVDYF